MELRGWRWRCCSCRGLKPVPSTDVGQHTTAPHSTVGKSDSPGLLRLHMYIPTYIHTSTNTHNFFLKKINLFFSLKK